ncbi:uncharacterized protein BKA78DRAFT_323892 [Phyllosticta capitalensis]|uniref:uncharacterized protein n=1 Tax=Phyllosticta capitalensis TaxID=121624 RepID=UPI0031322D06
MLDWGGRGGEGGAKCFSFGLGGTLKPGVDGALSGFWLTIVSRMFAEDGVTLDVPGVPGTEGILDLKLWLCVWSTTLACGFIDGAGSLRLSP